MSLLLDKLAQAAPRMRHPFAAFGEPIVCRLCGCDDDHACIDPAGNACSWILIDVAMPTGICSGCAAAAGWREFFFCYAAIEDEAA
jgi:hypothetical protein